MRPIRLLPLAICLALLGSCDDGGDPLSPDGGPLVLTGAVLFESSNTHAVPLTDDTTVRIELTGVRARLIEIDGVTDPDLALGFSLGTFSDEDCVSTFQVAMIDGDELVFRLPADNYCFVMFDIGNLPDDAIVDYTLLIT